MQTKKYNNGQRPSPPMPKTGPNLQRTIKAILGYQKTNGINPRSAIRPQQQHYHKYHKWAYIHISLSTVVYFLQLCAFFMFY
jgi:hypothetical protein